MHDSQTLENGREDVPELKNPRESLVPMKYRGMPSEIVEELWRDPIYIDAEKNAVAVDRRTKAIDEIKRGEVSREVQKENELAGAYSVLSAEQKLEFPQMQKEAAQALGDHIQGQNDLVGLLPEEFLVLDKIRAEYVAFKNMNPDKPFVVDFEKQLDKKVYYNLAQRLAFKASDDRKMNSDQEKADGIRNRLELLGQKDADAVPSEKLGAPTDVHEVLGIEERKKLSGWSASYELAKIAESQNIDLAAISREDYAKFAIDNSLAIDDDQLRGATWERMATSLEELSGEIKRRKKEMNGSEADKAFNRFEYDMKSKAAEKDRFISDGVRVRQGTKDSNSWIFFGINESTDDESMETYKAYISVKDIHTLTPEKFVDFLKVLSGEGYDGDVKIFQDLANQAIFLNDQVVMHGRSKADAELALRVAESFFGADLDQKGYGKDEIIDGENRSYSQILATKIKDAVDASK